MGVLPVGGRHHDVAVLDAGVEGDPVTAELGLERGDQPKGQNHFFPEGGSRGARSEGGSQLMHSQFVMYEEEFKLISALCERLNRDANAKAVLLVDKNGQCWVLIDDQHGSKNDGWMIKITRKLQHSF